jgi:uncharacterized SAM-binding protein YcdF (DUF218 family)
MNVTPEVLAHAQALWDYNALEMPAGPADVLLVMGHADLGVPRRAAELVNQFAYRFIVTTGGVYHQTSPLGEAFEALEAIAFQREMIKHGVPATQVLIEDKAQNTGDNINYSKALLSKETITSVQLVHTPIMRRRAYATACQQWPGVEHNITSEQTTLSAYCQGRNVARVITTLVGDTARILHYPTLGFQIPQKVPTDVQASLRFLIQSAGFTHNLPSGFTRHT